MVKTTYWHITFGKNVAFILDCLKILKMEKKTITFTRRIVPLVV